MIRPIITPITDKEASMEGVCPVSCGFFTGDVVIDLTSNKIFLLGFWEIVLVVAKDKPQPGQSQYTIRVLQRCR